MKKITAIAITVTMLMIGLQGVDAQATIYGQPEVMSPYGPVLIENDGPYTTLGYTDGAESVPTPQSADHEENLFQSLAKGCRAVNMFEDYSCYGPQYPLYGAIYNSSW